MKKCRLGDIAVISAGQGAPQDSSDYCDYGVPFIKAANLKSLSEGGSLSEIQRVTPEAAKKHKLKLHPSGTIVFAKSGMSCLKGIVYALPSPSYVVNHLATVTPNRKGISPYLQFYFQYHKPNRLIKDDAYPSISLSDIANIEIRLPEEAMQARRVNVLNHVVGLIYACKAALVKLDELVKARFVEMFGDFVENPRNWRVEELGDYIVFMTSGPRGWSKYFSDAGEYFLTIRNVKGCNVFTENIQHVRCPNNAEADRAKVKEGDLLISITADLGRTGVVSEQIANHGTYINQHLMCVRLMKEMLHPVYVAHLLESEGGRLQFSQKNQSAVKAGLNYESIRTLKIMVPPMHLQLAFVAFITQVDKSKVVVEMRGKNLTWRERCAKRVNEAFSIPNLSFSRDYGLGICTGKTQAD